MQMREMLMCEINETMKLLMSPNGHDFIVLKYETVTIWNLKSQKFIWYSENIGRRVYNDQK